MATEGPEGCADRLSHYKPGKAETWSSLTLGGIFDITMNQLVLQRAVDFGVTYWDTANVYTNGRSETGIGMFLEKNPEIRKELFLVTKAGTHSVDSMSRMLEESLRRMKTDYVDM